MADLNQRNKLEQGRADFAFKKAVQGYNLHRKEYAQFAKKVPMMIKTNGLGAAAAFMYSKQKNTPGTVLKHIEEWAATSPDNLKTHLILKNAEGGSFVQKLLNLNSYEYRIVTMEVLAFITWVRRFAEGIVKEREEEEKKKQQ
ncbi:MAG: type III-B CRISPR module-associated protein Cmr5 [Saprospiraceae bacterium]|nr:type III-B CRISPR module-associated protein Cmr5 [Saprospiraceae bacterium]MDZ4703092.1 type III-B CRISPR module-associated protein Cmr5 [Saprospiraceae bacterium]